MSRTYQLFHNSIPKEGDLVLVIFNERNEMFFDGHLIDFNFKAFLSLQNATRKHKVYSWNQIIQLNKPMVAMVESVEKDLIELSTAFLEDLVRKSKKMDPLQIQNNLMNIFKENEKFENFVKSICIVNNLDINEIWSKYVHPFDKARQEEDNKQSFWSYFESNIDNLGDFIPNEKFIDFMKELYEKRTIKTNSIKTSKIGIISTGSIESIKKVLELVKDKIDYEWSLKYDTAPYYNLTTNSDCDHKEFVKILEEYAKKTNVFIQIKNLAT